MALTRNGFASDKRQARLSGTAAAVVTLTLMLMLISGVSDVTISDDDVIVFELYDPVKQHIITGPPTLSVGGPD